MIDQQQQIDHAEHAAVDAEQAAEREAEAAHEQVRAQLIDTLLDLAEQQQDKARRLLVEGTLPTINARGHLGPSHLLYLGRAAEVAHLAGRCALTVERFGGYALGGQVEALLLAHLAQTAARTSAGHHEAHERAEFAVRIVRGRALNALNGTREATGLPGAQVPA